MLPVNCTDAAFNVWLGVSLTYMGIPAASTLPLGPVDVPAAVVAPTGWLWLGIWFTLSCTFSTPPFDPMT